MNLFVSSFKKRQNLSAKQQHFGNNAQINKIIFIKFSQRRLDESFLNDEKLLT